MNDNDKNETNDKTRRPLLLFFYTYVALAAGIVIFGESGTVFDSIDTTTGGTTEYSVLTVMELITVCLLPLALKMMGIRKITDLVRKDDKKYTSFAAIRLAMIGVPLVVNIIAYYIFMNVAFAYLAIIGAVCLAFVYPSHVRKESEQGK